MSLLRSLKSDGSTAYKDAAPPGLTAAFMMVKLVSFSDAKKAGFIVLKRVNNGEYERQ